MVTLLDYKYYTKPINQTTIHNDKLFIDTSTNQDISGLTFHIDNGFKKSFKQLYGISGKDKKPFKELYESRIGGAFNSDAPITFYTVGNIALSVFESTIDPVRPAWVDKIEKWCVDERAR